MNKDMKDPAWWSDEHTGDRPNPKSTDEEWDRYEAGSRFGVGARREFGRPEDAWDDRVEAKLRDEWNKLDTAERWERTREGVRSGWERGAKGDDRS